MSVSRTTRVATADVIGLGALAELVFLVFRWLYPDDGYRVIAGVVACLFLSIGALCMWHGEKTSKQITRPSEWALLAAGSIPIGGMSFGVDMLIGSVSNPGVSPIVAGTRAGSPFGFLLTILICPGMTMIATAGFVRSFLVLDDDVDS